MVSEREDMPQIDGCAHLNFSPGGSTPFGTFLNALGGFNSVSAMPQIVPTFLHCQRPFTGQKYKGMGREDTESLRNLQAFAQASSATEKNQYHRQLSSRLAMELLVCNLHNWKTILAPSICVPFHTLSYLSVWVP